MYRCAFAGCSRLALAAGAKSRPVVLRLASSETAVAAPAAPQKKGILDSLGEVYVPPDAGDWPKMDPNFAEFPERDTANFPHPVNREFHSKVRLGVVPDSWFRFFYEKTGETGGYLFLGGLGATLLSTELIVLDHSLQKLIPNAILIYLGTLLFSQKLARWADQNNKEDFVKLRGFKEAQLQSLKHGIATEEQAQKDYQVINDLLFDAKRENVFLQLEAEYRQRLQTVYEEVRRRLDFMVEYERARARFQLKHMADWIVSEVRKSITPQLEAATMEQCVRDLKVIAQKQRD